MDRAFFAMSLRIAVEQLSGEMLVLEVTQEMKLREVKQQIKDMHAWEDELSRDTTFVEMLFGDRKLGNDETVAEVGLAADSVATAILRQNVALCSNKVFFGPDIDPETLIIVEIPDSETEIGESAFVACERVAYVTIPTSVRRIRNFAFHRNLALRHVTIPDTVTDIGWRAFHGCKSLTSITIPDSVTHIGYGAFAGCSSLVSVKLPNSMTQIENDAFANCSNLKDVTVPDSVHMGRNVFMGPSTARVHPASQNPVQAMKKGRRSPFSEGETSVGPNLALKSSLVLRNRLVVARSLYVAHGAWLRLLPGCQLLFTSNASMYVEGRLEVLGSEAGTQRPRRLMRS